MIAGRARAPTAAAPSWAPPRSARAARRSTSTTTPRPASLRLTTLLYALPDGTPVQRVGLTPTLRFPFAPSARRRSRGDPASRAALVARPRRARPRGAGARGRRHVVGRVAFARRQRRPVQGRRHVPRAAHAGADGRDGAQDDGGQGAVGDRLRRDGRRALRPQHAHHLELQRRDDLPARPPRSQRRAHRAMRQLRVAERRLDHLRDLHAARARGPRPRRRARRGRPRGPPARSVAAAPRPSATRSDRRKSRTSTRLPMPSMRRTTTSSVAASAAAMRSRSHAIAAARVEHGRAGCPPRSAPRR